MSTNPTFGVENSQFHTDIYQTYAAINSINTITTSPGEFPVGPAESTNADISSQIKSFAGQFAAQALGSYTGFPQVISIDTNKGPGGVYYSKFATLPLDNDGPVKKNFIKS